MNAVANRLTYAVVAVAFPGVVPATAAVVITSFAWLPIGVIATAVSWYNAQPRLIFPHHWLEHLDDERMSLMNSRIRPSLSIERSCRSIECPHLAAVRWLA